jgi:hypothetical protein
MHGGAVGFDDGESVVVDAKLVLGEATDVDKANTVDLVRNEGEEGLRGVCGAGVVAGGVEGGAVEAGKLGVGNEEEARRAGAYILVPWISPLSGGGSLFSLLGAK